jgi:predicted dehydrogenase
MEMDEVLDLERLNWGFVGTGEISSVVAREVIAHNSGRLAAVTSRDMQRAKAFASLHGFAECYDDLAKMLAQADIDAVYIALPHSLHAPVTLQAMDAGKHVLCEKPLATRASDIQVLIDHPNAGNLIVTEGFMIRHHSQWKWVESIINSGALGTIKFVQSFFSFEHRPSNDTFDLMYDVGCYCVHISRLLFQGSPTSFFAGALSDSIISANIQFEAGISQFSVSTDTANAGRIRILGSSGSIELFDPIRPPGGTARIQYIKNGQEAEDLTFGPDLQFGEQFAHFARVVKGDAPRLISLQDSMINARCIEEIIRSTHSLMEERF